MPTGTLSETTSPTVEQIREQFPNVSLPTADLPHADPEKVKMNDRKFAEKTRPRRSVSKEVAEAKALLADIDSLESASDESLAKAQEKRWEFANLTFEVTQGEQKKTTKDSWAKSLGLSPSYVSQIAKVGAEFGDANFRVANLSFNDHLELVRVPADQRDAVVEDADYYGSSIESSRKRMARETKEKQIAADARAEALSEGSDEPESSSGGGSGKHASSEIEKAANAVMVAIADFEVAVANGGTITAKRSQELMGTADSFVAAVKQAKVVKRVRRTPDAQEDANEAAVEAPAEAPRKRRRAIKVDA